MARHAVVDLMQVFHLKIDANAPDRLPVRDLAKLRETLALPKLALPEDGGRMQELRAQYEPFVYVLSQFLAMDLAPWIPPPNAHDNWTSSNFHV